MTELRASARPRGLRTYLGQVHHPRGASWPSEKIEASDTGRVYKFNTLGYRSEEYNQSAKLKIFTAGCSYIFGTGVSDDDVWTVHLKRRLKDQTGMSEEDVNILNFSQVGASNHYICRTMLEQCQQVKPDLAIVCFTHADRTEHFSGSDVENVGPWKIPSEIASKDDLNHAAWRYMFYENGVGNFETLKHMLVLHNAFQRCGVPYVFFWVEHAILHGQEIASCEGLQALAALTHMMHLQNFSILSPQIFVDKEAGHPGKESHKRFGEQVSAVVPFYLRGRVDTAVARNQRQLLPRQFSNALRQIPRPRKVLHMGSWCGGDLNRSLKWKRKALLQEERLQSLDYVIRRLPTVNTHSIDHFAVMDSRPHFREICFRDNFMEFDLRAPDSLPAPISAVVQAYANYILCGSLIGQHLLNMLALLAVSEMTGSPTYLLSMIDISKLDGRVVTPWLNELCDLEVRPGLYSSNCAANWRIQSVYDKILHSGSGRAELEWFTAESRSSIDDASVLATLLDTSKKANGFNMERNNYSLK